MQSSQFNDNSLIIDKKYNVVSYFDFIENGLQQKQNTIEKYFGIIEVPLRSVLHEYKDYILNSKKEGHLDKIYIDNTNKYIQTLPFQELYNLYGYTTNYGYELLNNYMRGLFHKKQLQRLFKDLRLQKQWSKTMYDISQSYSTTTYFPFFFPTLKILSLYTPETISECLINKNKITRNFSNVFRKLIDDKISYAEKHYLIIDVLQKLNIECWIKIFKLYCENINRSIQNIPPLNKEMIVYRGVNKDIIENQTMFESTQFISTSTSFNKAMNFIDKNQSCCLMRIVLPPGSKCLLISGVSLYDDEAEVLLPLHSKFLVHDVNNPVKNNNKLLRMYTLTMVVD